MSSGLFLCAQDVLSHLRLFLYTRSRTENDQSAPTSECPSANKNESVEFSKPSRHLPSVLTEVSEEEEEEEDVVCLFRVRCGFIRRLANEQAVDIKEVKKITGWILALRIFTSETAVSP
ncbi:hypothetical protein KOW79_011528 [Hemibagrus wyckioides]|uniref:Uncharacterized protein n=1 Tax=Hemibagrus wyckioides TaxID=337641 RepID=A0A9D3NN10_9TELE|nr:hypothetical protein KOW79_011528 [Hemibagrus wyckioides]